MGLWLGWLGHGMAPFLDGQTGTIARNMATINGFLAGLVGLAGLAGLTGLAPFCGGPKWHHSKELGRQHTGLWLGWLGYGMAPFGGG